MMDVVDEVWLQTAGTDMRRREDMRRLPDVIVTPRTRLRPYEFRDVDDVFAYASDPEWRRYLPVPESHRVMEKIGMRREGVLRQNRYARGEFMDEVWYGILRTKWNALTPLGF